MYIYKGNVQRHGAIKRHRSGLLAIAEQKRFAGQNGQRNRRARPHYRLLVAILKFFFFEKSAQPTDRFSGLQDDRAD